ncbi:hypothetical protein FS842_005461 [Serendipita sp. 407]|nr:hypothetical protein FS842_005461 [Serendipita sp. 407]
MNVCAFILGERHRQLTFLQSDRSRLKKGHTKPSMLERIFGSKSSSYPQQAHYTSYPQQGYYTSYPQQGHNALYPQHVYPQQKHHTSYPQQAYYPANTGYWAQKPHSRKQRKHRNHDGSFFEILANSTWGSDGGGSGSGSGDGGGGDAGGSSGGGEGGGGGGGG